MSSAFSTSDTECLNRETEHSVHDAAANFDQIWDKQRLNECLQFIDSHQCNKASIPLHSIPFLGLWLRSNQCYNHTC